jgi:hypothetical protein
VERRESSTRRTSREQRLELSERQRKITSSQAQSERILFIREEESLKIAEINKIKESLISHGVASRKNSFH